MQIFALQSNYKSITSAIAYKCHMRKNVLTLELRKKVQEKLPISVSHGYDLILEKMTEHKIEITRNQISQAFTINNRYRADVFDYALMIIEESKNPVTDQEKLIEQL